MLSEDTQFHDADLNLEVLDNAESVGSLTQARNAEEIGKLHSTAQPGGLSRNESEPSAPADGWEGEKQREECEDVQHLGSMMSIQHLVSMMSIKRTGRAQPGRAQTGSLLLQETAQKDTSCSSVLQNRFRIYAGLLRSAFRKTVLIEVSFFVAWSAFVVYFIATKEDANVDDLSNASNMGGYVVASLGGLLMFLNTFHNKACEDRWWEGRCLWGRQVYASINLVHQTCAWVSKKELAWRIVSHTIAFNLLCKGMLRNQPVDENELIEVLGEIEIDRIKNGIKTWKPYYCLEVLRACITEAFLHNEYGKGVQDLRFLQMDAEVSTLAACIGGCIRIKGTPIPEAQEGLMVTFSFLYLLALPVGVATTCNWWTLLVSALASWLLRGLQESGWLLVQPFFILNLDAFCQAVCVQCGSCFIFNHDDLGQGPDSSHL